MCVVVRKVTARVPTLAVTFLALLMDCAGDPCGRLSPLSDGLCRFVRTLVLDGRNQSRPYRVLPTKLSHRLCRDAGGCGWVVGTLVGVLRCNISASLHKFSSRSCE